MVATLRGGIRVMLGDETDMRKKIALIDPILSQVVRKGKPADAIDLRARRIRRSSSTKTDSCREK